MVHPRAPTIPSAFATHALQLLQQVQRGISPIELVYTTHEYWPLRLEDWQITYVPRSVYLSSTPHSIPQPWRTWHWPIPFNRCHTRASLLPIRYTMRNCYCSPSAMQTKA
ncbi:hypothetical protein JVU11DRAFT_4373 [Chiua virens]|nr:hypothetical protein JVU11DRAFT_4373 [Chiua virens]